MQCSFYPNFWISYKTATFTMKMHLYSSSLSSCVLLLAYFCYIVSSSPVPTFNHILLSENTNLFVRIADNGSITADGELAQAAVFYVYHNPQPNFFTFELINLTKPSGQFLMINPIVKDETNAINSTAHQQNFSSPSDSLYELVVGIPSSVSHIQWEAVYVGNGMYPVLKQTLDNSWNCFIAFNDDSSVAGPCNLSQDDRVTQTRVCSYNGI